MVKYHKIFQGEGSVQQTDASLTVPQVFLAELNGICNYSYIHFLPHSQESFTSLVKMACTVYQLIVLPYLVL